MRQRFAEHIIESLRPKKSMLSDDSQRRLEGNPRPPLARAVSLVAARYYLAVGRLPADRIAYMLEDAKASLVISESALAFSPKPKNSRVATVLPVYSSSTMSSMPWSFSM